MRKKNGEGSSQALGRGTQKSRGMLTEIYEMNNYDSNYCELVTSIQSWKNLYLSLNKIAYIVHIQMKKKFHSQQLCKLNTNLCFTKHKYRPTFIKMKIKIYQIEIDGRSESRVVIDSNDDSTISKYRLSKQSC
jgi:hypothetical protein